MPRLTEETMALPKAIEEQARRADELMNAGKTKPAEAPTAAPADQGTPPAAPAPAAAAPAAAPAPAPELQPPAMPDAEPKDFQQKYRVLQGKYNAEVVRVQADNRQLKSDVQTLQAQVDELKRQLTAAPAAPAAPKLPTDVTPEEVEQYGEDFVNFVRRVAGGDKTVDLSAVEQRLRPVEEIALRSAKSAFFNDLGAAAPQWEVLNTDAGFLGWLAEHDPLTGVQRQTLFDDAYGKLDVARCAAFFNAYGGQSVGAAPTALPTLQEQVAPRSGNPPPPTPPGPKRLWRQAEVQAFYEQVRRREVSPEEAAKIEQDIFAAQRENRIR